MSTDGLEDNGEFDPEKSKGPVYIKVTKFRFNSIGAI